MSAEIYSFPSRFGQLAGGHDTENQSLFTRHEQLALTQCVERHSESWGIERWHFKGGEVSFLTVHDNGTPHSVVMTVLKSRGNGGAFSYQLNLNTQKSAQTNTGNMQFVNFDQCLMGMDRFLSFGPKAEPGADAGCAP